MLKEYLTSIANAIRSKLGSTAKINAQDFAVKIDEVFNEGYLQGVPYGYRRGKEEGKLELLQDSEYMNVKVSGTIIAVNDVNSIEHSVGCKVDSKNLLPYPKFEPTQTTNGITFTNNGDGSITLNGTATTEAIYQVITQLTAIPIKSGNYILSGSISDNIWIQGKVVEDDTLSFYNQGTPARFTLNNDYSFRFNIRVTSGTVCENVIIKPQLELGTTASAYTPYVANVGGIEVSRLGKNLLPYPYSHTTQTINGVTFTNNGDGTITANGTATANADFHLQYGFNIKKGMYVSSGTNGDSDSTYELFVNGLEGTILRSYGNNRRANYDFVANVFIRVRSGAVVKNVIFKPQLEYNTFATPYEPYIEPTTYQSTADGTVKGITSISPNMTLLTNNNNVVINANYLRDIDTYIDNLKTNVALTGGE